MDGSSLLVVIRGCFAAPSTLCVSSGIVEVR
jgi:hypothetical protein